MKQIDFEKSADVYMFSKLLYMKRPGIFRSKVNYSINNMKISIIRNKKKINSQFN